jgi:Signal recognition particle receptor beta subunit
MVGLNDSGKTLMFSRIVHDQYVKTFTSVNENVGEVTCTKVT